MVAERDRSVAYMDNSVEWHNTNQISSESLKAAKYHKKQEIALLTEDMELIKISVAYFQIEAKAVSSENNIAISKLQKLRG